MPTFGEVEEPPLLELGAERREERIKKCTFRPLESKYRIICTYQTSGK
jgi:hypothetical protein